MAPASAVRGHGMSETGSARPACRRTAQRPRRGGRRPGRATVDRGRGPGGRPGCGPGRVGAAGQSPSAGTACGPACLPARSRRRPRSPSCGAAPSSRRRGHEILAALADRGAGSVAARPRLDPPRHSGAPAGEGLGADLVDGAARLRGVGPRRRRSRPWGAGPVAAVGHPRHRHGGCRRRQQPVPWSVATGETAADAGRRRPLVLSLRRGRHEGHGRPPVEAIGVRGYLPSVPPGETRAAPGRATGLVLPWLPSSA